MAVGISYPAWCGALSASSVMWLILAAFGVLAVSSFRIAIAADYSGVRLIVKGAVLGLVLLVFGVKFCGAVQTMGSEYLAQQCAIPTQNQ